MLAENAIANFFIKFIFVHELSQKYIFLHTENRKHEWATQNLTSIGQRHSPSPSLLQVWKWKSLPLGIECSLIVSISTSFETSTLQRLTRGAVCGWMNHESRLIPLSNENHIDMSARFRALARSRLLFWMNLSSLVGKQHNNYTNWWYKIEQSGFYSYLTGRRNRIWSCICRWLVIILYDIINAVFQRTGNDTNESSSMSVGIWNYRIACLINTDAGIIQPTDRSVIRCDLYLSVGWA